MFRLIGIGLTALVVLLAILLGWNDIYHLTFIGLAVVIVVVVEILIRSRRKPTPDYGLPAASLPPALADLNLGNNSPAPALVVGAGLIRGIAILVVAWLLLFAGRTSTLEARYYDRGYGELVAKLRNYEEAGNNQLIVSTVDDRLKSKISGDKRRELAQFKYRALIGFGEKAASEVDRQKYYTEAADWAEQERLAPEQAQAARKLAQPTPTPPPPIVVTATPPPPVVITVTPTPTIRPQPRPLPPGSQVELVRVQPEAGLVRVDFAATGPDGKQYQGLEPRDIRVFINGQEVQLDRTSLASIASQPVYVSIAFDRSGSMIEGGTTPTPLKRAHDAVTSLVSGLRPTDRVRVVAFDDRLQTTEFMPPADAVNFVNGIQAGGDTALWDAVAAAGTGVPAGVNHILIVLTDGRDTASARGNRNTVETASRSATGSLVYIVGIESPDFVLGRPVLEQFANAVNSRVRSSDAAGIGAIFNDIARQTRGLYRATALLPAGTNAQQLRVHLDPQYDLTWP